MSTAFHSHANTPSNSLTSHFQSLKLEHSTIIGNPTPNKAHIETCKLRTPLTPDTPLHGTTTISTKLNTHLQQFRGSLSFSFSLSLSSTNLAHIPGLQTQIGKALTASSYPHHLPALKNQYPRYTEHHSCIVIHIRWITYSLLREIRKANWWGESVCDKPE